MIVRLRELWTGTPYTLLTVVLCRLTFWLELTQSLGLTSVFQILAVDRLHFDENFETDDAAVDIDAASTSNPSSATLSFVGVGRTCIVWSILPFGAYLTI